MNLPFDFREIHAEGLDTMERLADGQKLSPEAHTGKHAALQLGAGDFLLLRGNLLLCCKTGLRGGFGFGVSLGLCLFPAGLFVVVAVAGDSLHAFLEAAQTLAHALAELGKLLTAEQKDCDAENNQPMPRCEFHIDFS